MNSLTGLVGVATNGITIPLPDIHLTGLGQGSDGITPAELTQTVLSQITTGAITGVANYAKTNLTGAASGLLKGAGGGVDKIKSGLGGLFGKYQNGIFCLL